MSFAWFLSTAVINREQALESADHVAGVSTSNA